MKKSTIMAVGLVVVMLLLAGCAGVDVVLKYSPDALNDMTQKYQSLVSEADGYYKVTVDGKTSLKISKDYSAGTEDILLETPLAPFTAAGLDTAKLGEGYKAEGDKLYLTADYGKGKGEKDNATDALLESVAFDRKVLSYHQELDHYGVKLPGGKFEWAKEHQKNDKDIVFVIAAKPLADIGVDVQNIDGWVFETMKDIDGSDIDVLLKPYDLQQ